MSLLYKTQVGIVIRNQTIYFLTLALTDAHDSCFVCALLTSALYKKT